MDRKIRFAFMGVLATLALVIGPASAGAAEEQSTASSTSSSTTLANTTTTTSSAPAPETSTSATPAVPVVSETESTTTTTATTAATPEVQAQLPQATSAPRVTGASTHARNRRRLQTQTKGVGRARRETVSPSAQTPPLPFKLSLAGSDIPDFFISTFSIPPFLLPIYQAAGTAYDIPWQVLAAINEVETDYGRDVNVSSAGAEGWMQFLPAEWQQYGLDVTNDGYEDPYNPVDAIFTAARYLAAAGGAHNIRGAVYAYNHSQTYVESVMLRAELLGGTPPGLLSAITGLSEARFPVHASAHFSDGFPLAPATPTSPAQSLAGTVIYSEAGAPVIAVQDGEVTALGQSPTLGRYISLRDSYGNTYTYAELGSVASVYPVLVPRESSASESATAASEPAPPTTGPVAPASEAGSSTTSPSAPPSPESGASPQHFQAGPEEVYLHPLHPGVSVIAGTVLGHLGTGTEGEVSSDSPVTPGSVPQAPHILFQIRPAGVGASLIDPKPILDGWVELEDTSIFRAKGGSPFATSSPTAGQVLLESRSQLQQQVLSDKGIHIYRCGRDDIQSGEIDRRVLATLEFLSVSGLQPTVSALKCGDTQLAAPGALSGYADGDAVGISAINGTPIAGHEGPGSVVDEVMSRLLGLQGTMKPAQIEAPTSRTGARKGVEVTDSPDLIGVAFGPTEFSVPKGSKARIAGSDGSLLSASQWVALIDRLGQIPSPVVRSGHSAAAIPDPPRTLSQGEEPSGNG